MPIEAYLVDWKLDILYNLILRVNFTYRAILSNWFNKASWITQDIKQGLAKISFSNNIKVRFFSYPNIYILNQDLEIINFHFEKKSQL